jgi:hypothetical protein
MFLALHVLRSSHAAHLLVQEAAALHLQGKGWSNSSDTSDTTAAHSVHSQRFLQDVLTKTSNASTTPQEGLVHYTQAAAENIIRMLCLLCYFNIATNNTAAGAHNHKTSAIARACLQPHCSGPIIFDI